VDCGGGARKVVGGVAAGDQVDREIGDGEVLGIAADEGDIGQAALSGETAPFGQHLFGEIDGGDAGDVGGEGQRGVTGAGGDIEHTLAAAKLTGGGEAPPAWVALAA
jgi:hypothetical protein